MLSINLYNSKAEKILPSLKNFDSLVCDPPAGISFMGHEWDSDRGGRAKWIEWMTGMMRLSLDALKPGAHCLVWAFPRTSHWTATALEDAGFEIRDRVSHIFGKGWNKSKHFLKPCMEDWWLCRKPIEEKNVEENIAKWGTGGIFAERCRIPLNPEYGDKRSFGSGRWDTTKSFSLYGKYNQEAKNIFASGDGRWPANVTHDGSDEVIAMFPHTKSGSGAIIKEGKNTGAAWGKESRKVGTELPSYGDEGSASRFFYCSKASPKDRDEGCGDNDHPSVKSTNLMRWLIKLITPEEGHVLDCFMGTGSTGKAAVLEGMSFTGIEQDSHYFDIARKRIGFVADKNQIMYNPINVIQNS